MIDVMAMAFAIGAHAAIDQRRKYTGDPYIVHPRAVVKILRDHGINDPHVIGAAWLHDVVEDTQVTIEQIETTIGPRIGHMVSELTNVPLEFGNRRARLWENLRRSGFASPDSQNIKLADLIDNTRSIVQYDPKFAPKYLEEKADTIDVLTRAKPLLIETARKTLQAGWDQLKNKS
ncbi:HD domain-containing protein [Brucella intermedia]|uniref:HD domain-containing protein n=1 Tax=Brucella intermedia TaxID=94625 RepID=UPI00224B5891|nr:HD domain-containing protein [Brucella intermedia]